MWVNGCGRSPKMSVHERFAQVTHQKWAPMSESLRLLIFWQKKSDSLIKPMSEFLALHYGDECFGPSFFSMSVLWKIQCIKLSIESVLYFMQFSREKNVYFKGGYNLRKCENAYPIMLMKGGDLVLLKCNWIKGCLFGPYFLKRLFLCY